VYDHLETRIFIVRTYSRNVD